MTKLRRSRAQATTTVTQAQCTAHLSTPAAQLFAGLTEAWPGHRIPARLAGRPAWPRRSALCGAWAAELLLGLCDAQI